MVSRPPYKEWAGFKWLLQECSARPLCSVLLQLSSQKTSPIARSCTVQLSHGRLLWNFRNSINDGRRSKGRVGLVALWTWEQTCSVTKVREADSSPKTPRSSIHSILSPLKAVCPARKKDMGVKSVVELYNLLLSSFFVISKPLSSSQSIGGLKPHLLYWIHQKVFNN